VTATTGVATMTAAAGNVDINAIGAAADVDIDAGNDALITGANDFTATATTGVATVTAAAGNVDINAIGATSDVDMDAGRDVNITGAIDINSVAKAGTITNTAGVDIINRAVRNIANTSTTGNIYNNAAININSVAGQDINQTAGRDINLTATRDVNISAQKITIGNTDGSSTVVLPGLKDGGNETDFATIDSGGELGRTDFSVGDVKNALRDVDKGINQVGAMAMAVSALPNLTTGDKKYGCGVGTGVMGSRWAGAAGCTAKVSDSIWINAAVSYSPEVKTKFGSTSNFAGRLGAFWQF
jgi:hypothetical protein